jgi:hypothetical protein
MILLTNTSIEYQVLGFDLDSIEWRELPESIFIDNYLESTGGQLAVFLIAVLLFTKVRSSYLKLILIILQSPFIFYAGFVSLKTIIDTFLDSTDDFSRNLFSSIPSLFVLTIIFLSLFYQFISQKSAKRRPNADPEGHKITFIKDHEIPSDKNDHVKRSDSVEIVPVKKLTESEAGGGEPLVVSSKSNENLEPEGGHEAYVPEKKAKKRKNLRDRWSKL